MKLLKEVFIKDKIGNAFEEKLKYLLKDIELDQISSKHTSFYLENINTDEKKQTKIKNKTRAAGSDLLSSRTGI